MSGLHSIVLAGLFSLAGCCTHVSSDSKSPGVTEQSGAATQPNTLKDTTIEDGRMPLGKASYSASQQNGVVVLVATGENSTPGWKNAFVPSMLRIWPPQFSFHSQRPEGIVSQVVTPFSVSTQFKSDDPVAQIKVTDSEGDHWVQVTQSDKPAVR